MGVFSSVGNALSKIFAFIGINIDKWADNDALNEAVVQQKIKEQAQRADKANYANGQLATQIVLLRDQVRNQKNKKLELEGGIKDCVARNDELLGSELAEQLAGVEQDLVENQNQLDTSETLYQQNKEVIGNCLRETQRIKADFERLKTKVAVSKQMAGLANLMKGSISELQGMLGNQLGDAMDSLRKSAAEGEGQMRATMDMATQMGSNLKQQQDLRKAKGRSLFQEYKSKFAMVQQDGAKVSTSPASVTEQKSQQKQAMVN
jgi:hypothetical protein